MRRTAPIALVVALAIISPQAQQPAGLDARLLGQLTQLFPEATFSPKAGEPPHFKAFRPDPASGAPAVTGFAFWTTELDPLERGYDGPIKMLVGMDLKGTLTGALVVDHHEPYGSFSVDRPEFAAQFKGKSVRDRFSVGEDIAAVSRATMTVSSAARGVRNSARKVATALIRPPGR